MSGASDYIAAIKDDASKGFKDPAISERVFLTLPPAALLGDLQLAYRIRKSASKRLNLPITQIQFCGSVALGMSPYIDDVFDVDGKKFSELNPEEKSEFLKYEVPLIDLDMDQNDRRIIDVFGRLNRTQFALSAIEKQATEYGATEFMLVAKLLCGELDLGSQELTESLGDLNVDPNISPDFLVWAGGKSDNKFRELVLNERIFTPYEISRKVQLQFTLNVMSAVLRGPFNRNELSRDLLEEFKDAFPERDVVYSDLCRVADYILKMRLPEKSIWWRKANIFTLLTTLAKSPEGWDTPTIAKAKLEGFAENLPEQFALAGREAVNNRKERVIREKYLKHVLFDTPLEPAIN